MALPIDSTPGTSSRLYAPDHERFLSGNLEAVDVPAVNTRPEEAPELTTVEHLNNENRPQHEESSAQEAYTKGKADIPPPTKAPRRRRIVASYKKHRIIVWLGALGIAAIIAIVCAVAITQTKKNGHSTSPSESASSTGPTSKSTALANGGLALATLADGSGTIKAYVQMPNSQLVELSYSPSTGWSSTSSQSDVVTTSAKNATPIAAISYNVKQTLTRHVFYIDNDDLVAEAVNNGTGGWTQPQGNGSLFDLKPIAFSPPTVGLAACWSDRWLGDPNLNVGGMRLYYINQDTIQELYWGANSPVWAPGFSFDANRNSGVACTTNGSSVLNVYLQAPDLTLEQWWFDFNPADDYQGFTHHWYHGLNFSNFQLINQITAINNGTHDVVHVQIPENATISELTILSNAQNSNQVSSEQINLGLAYNDTRLSSTYTQGKLHVLYQDPTLHIQDQAIIMNSSTTTLQMVPVGST